MIWEVILYFAIFSFCGWVSETIICSIDNKKFIKRGFLNGPFIPVYGFGGLIIIYILAPFKENLLLLFLMGCISTTILEYATAWIMESIFKTKLWDYSKYKLNFQGRIWLISSLFFGLLSILAVYVIYPPVQNLFSRLPQKYIPIISIVFIIYFITDTILSTLTLLQINGKLAEITILFEEAKSSIHLPELDIIDNLKNFTDKNSTKYKNLNAEIKENLSNLSIKIKNTTKLNWSHKRMLDAFPNMKSHKYNQQLLHLKEQLKEYRISKKTK